MADGDPPPPRKPIKKEFKPNILPRKGRPSAGKTKAPSASPNQARKNDRGRGSGRGSSGRGRGGRKVYTQNQGIFSKGFGGPTQGAPKPKAPPRARSVKTEGGSSSGRKSNAAAPKPSSKVTFEAAEDVMADRMEEWEWFQDMKLEDQPLVLPLKANTREDVEELNAEMPMSGGGEADIPDGAKSSSAFDTLNKDDGRFVFFQLPDVLPSVIKKDSEEMTKKKNADGDLEPDLLTDVTFESALKYFGDGQFGKIQIRKSGKKELIIGNCTLIIEPASDADFLQEVVAMDDGQAPSEIVSLGHLTDKYTATPNIQQLLVENGRNS
eukprot:m.30849 g.30849  ORF g.30849 m.30849 type:complete len:324 (-) comp8251_c0_seq1:1967-2938(-)